MEHLGAILTILAGLFANSSPPTDEHKQQITIAKQVVKEQQKDMFDCGFDEFNIYRCKPVDYSLLGN